MQRIPFPFREIECLRYIQCSKLEIRLPAPVSREKSCRINAFRQNPRAVERLTPKEPYGTHL
jgi:hypothetical protein